MSATMNKMTSALKIMTTIYKDVKVTPYTTVFSANFFTIFLAPHYFSVLKF